METIAHFPKFAIGLVLFVSTLNGNLNAQLSVQTEHTIYDGRLSRGYDMGVASSSGQSGWVTNQDGYMRMAYPSGQSWGAVFITYGKPKGFPRPGKDFSGFGKLSVELRGANGGELVEIGLKDNEDPDDGSEAKVGVTVSKEWKIYEFQLNKFFTADLNNIYVITEFVFGYESATVDFRNVKFVVPSDIKKAHAKKASPQTLIQGHTIYDGRLSRGYDMGVASSGGHSGWVTNQDGYMHMAYPSGQSWGAVFITYGKPKGFPRPGKDFSGFEKLSVELRGANGGEIVEIGLKDNEDPDDGSEAKVGVTVSKEWKTYEFQLDKFFTADLNNIYVITEFVFGYESATVDFRNVKFVPGQRDTDISKKR